MGEYIDWSARDCDAECAAQVIQSSQDVAQSAQEAANSAAEATIALESINDRVNEIQELSENTEGQVIQLRIDIFHLSDEIELLRLSINDSMVPTIDESILLMILIILGAITLCLSLCLGVICYTSYIETKHKNRVNIIPQKKKKKEKRKIFFK